MGYINVRPSVRAGGTFVRGYRRLTAGTSPVGGNRIIMRGGRYGPTMSEGFGVVSVTKWRRGSIGGYPVHRSTSRSYVATRSSLGRFDRLFNRASGGGGLARRRVGFGLSSPLGRQ